MALLLEPDLYLVTHGRLDAQAHMRIPGISQDLDVVATMPDLKAAQGEMAGQEMPLLDRRAFTTETERIMGGDTLRRWAVHTIPF